MAHTADYERAPALVPSIPNWWRVCFVHGDQTKYYRKLYGRKSSVRSLRGADLPGAVARDVDREAE